MTLSTPRALLLACALLFNQLGGLIHGLSHYQHQEDQHHPHASCQLCAAYSILDSSVLGSPPTLPTCTHFAPIFLNVPVAVRHRHYFFYHSRAPPVDLV